MRRPRPDALLAIALPLAGAAALLLVRPAPATLPSATAPASTALTSAAVVCPSALPALDKGVDVLGASTLADGPDGMTSGSVAVGLGGALTDSDLATGRVATLNAGSGPVVVTGTGAVAPGLLAGRSTSQPLAATDCPTVRGDQWFTGVGAGAGHDSVLELVNPGTGTAAADITLWSSAGPVAVDRLRGVSVPGGTSTQLDLGQLAPRRGNLAVRVRVDRGQLATTVVDTSDELGDAPVVRDWLPGQAQAATDNLLLGLAPGSGERTLTLMNPGDDEVRATLRVVTATGVFTPSGVDPLRVPAGSTASVSLGSVLADQTAQGAIGLVVTSPAPLTAGLRQDTGDLSDLAPAETLTTSSAAVVPTGAKRLLLAGPSAVGVADVAWWAADGTRLGAQTVELKPDTGADLTLPDDAVLVTVDPQRTSVRAAVLIGTTGGTAVVGLRALQRSGLVPHVAPGLP